MSQITLGQIGLAVTFLVGLITGIGYLHTQMKTWMTELLKDQLNSISSKLDGLEKKIDDVDLESCKNYLVTFISKIEKGSEVDEIEKERFWEQYQHYEKIGGNSYIKRKVEQLKADGKL